MTYLRTTGTVMDHKRRLNGELVECDGSRQPVIIKPGAERQRRRFLRTLHAAGEPVEVTGGMPPRKR
ncbi:hypothetical protein AB0953_30985 [Streptomyces sp. NPDC046866]|uniref:hypothetical protein n=1 Tax=Streptomyces sp. NPDC046866 TaxID=3154921 RepID=UPI00345225DD